MIVVPEKVAFIKVPKAASTTIAKLFWAKYGVEQSTTVNRDVASTIRYFVTLEQLANQVPVINGNWFYQRSGAFGWHSSYADLSHIFGEQLKDYHWVASVRHPVHRLFSVFSFQVAKGRIKAEMTPQDFAAFCHRVFAHDPSLSFQQRVHTWPQNDWLPPTDHSVQLSIIRQEQFDSGISQLAHQIPAFQSAQLGHINRSFSGELAVFIPPRLARQIEDFYAVDMARFGYESFVTETKQVS